MIQIIPMPGIPEVTEGADLAALMIAAMRASSIEGYERDIFVVAQKVVSKAEGCVVKLDSVVPSGRAAEWAKQFDKDPRVVEVVLRESKRILKMEQGVIIAETQHGFVCANAGVDTSNVVEGTVALLPREPDASARRIQAGLERGLGIAVAVIISDTFGRPWRDGLTNVALGVAGLGPIVDYRGRNDWLGRPLRVTTIAIADELASAAELVMKKDRGIPAAIIRGLDYDTRDGSGRELLRPPEKDLFR
ncbi:MAG TPA: coenzyme F420-0:L-glutamate ligase [Blastocatellia bacterium]|nr:coenzyme F420-0:L-glutamate ligase [Blastocatellia bacterium]